MMTDFIGFHHFYLGWILILIGFLILMYGPKTKRNRNIALFFLTAGFLIMGDDILQHIIQYTDPNYRSPLHKLYGATLYKIGFIQKLNEWFD